MWLVNFVALLLVGRGLLIALLFLQWCGTRVSNAVWLFYGLLAILWFWILSGFVTCLYWFVVGLKTDKIRTKYGGIGVFCFFWGRVVGMVLGYILLCEPLKTSKLCVRLQRQKWHLTMSIVGGSKGTLAFMRFFCRIKFALCLRNAVSRFLFVALVLEAKNRRMNEPI